MNTETILVLTDPDDPQVEMLARKLAGVRIAAGNSAEAFVDATENATILCNWSGSLELFRKVFGMCPNLRWIHSRSVGVERTLFPELRKSPVVLTNGSGVFSASLGEFTLGAILYFAKDFRRLVRQQMAAKWEVFDVTMIQAKTVGIVGYGDIGRAVAARVRPLGMQVFALKRHTAHVDPLVDRVFGPAQRAEMISQSDYVVVAAPLTAETRGMIGEAELAVMKPTAVVINVGRGPIIEEKAMIRALSEGRIRGAALDVFDMEPLPAGHPFYSMDNVLLSPHSADHTPEWLADAMELFIEQFERYREGKPLRNVVDKKLGY